MQNLKCSICETPFDLASEGGIRGYFGMCEVAFCVWCYDYMTDMVEKSCLRCQEFEELGLEEGAPDKKP